jgi:CheY-like chemotaxis protein
MSPVAASLGKIGWIGDWPYASRRAGQQAAILGACTALGVRLGFPTESGWCTLRRAAAVETRLQTISEPVTGGAKPCRVFVVEDEVMIRMLLEDMLADLGYEIAASAGGLEEAVGLARNADFDVAILDVNLNGSAVYPVAEILSARGVPFVFSTGYGERGMPEPYRDRPTLQKPFQLENLDRALATVAPKSLSPTPTPRQALS